MKIAFIIPAADIRRTFSYRLADKFYGPRHPITGPLILGSILDHSGHQVEIYEELFKDILQVFAAMETSSIAIIEAKNIREYLARIPLFAGFWSDSHLGVNRIIAAIIDKSLTNETLRAIENITGSLDKRTDVMVTVQDIFYTSGSLKA